MVAYNPRTEELIKRLRDEGRLLQLLEEGNNGPLMRGVKSYEEPERKKISDEGEDYSTSSKN